MKNLKWVLMLAVVAAVGTAYASSTPAKGKTQAFVAVHSGGSFTWVEEPDPGICVSPEINKACLVFADERPLDNETPAGTLLGEYIP